MSGVKVRLSARACRRLAAAWLAVLAVAFAISVATSGADSAPPAPAATAATTRPSPPPRLADVAPLPDAVAATRPGRHRAPRKTHAKRVVALPTRVAPATRPVPDPTPSAPAPAPTQAPPPPAPAIESSQGFDSSD